MKRHSAKKKTTKYWVTCKVRKKKSTIQIQVKSRKNPYIDDNFISYMDLALFSGYKIYFSHAVAYYFGGSICDTCNMIHEKCSCEGMREHKFDKFGNVIQGSCEYCKENYCVCDYDIFDEKGDVVTEKVRMAAWKFMINTLNKDMFNKYIKSKYNFFDLKSSPWKIDMVKNSKFLQKIMSAYGEYVKR